MEVIDMFHLSTVFRNEPQRKPKIKLIWFWTMIVEPDSARAQKSLNVLERLSSDPHIFAPCVRVDDVADAIRYMQTNPHIPFSFILVNTVGHNINVEPIFRELREKQIELGFPGEIEFLFDAQNAPLRRKLLSFQENLRNTWYPNPE